MSLVQFEAGQVNAELNIDFGANPTLMLNRYVCNVVLDDVLLPDGVMKRHAFVDVKSPDDARRFRMLAQRAMTLRTYRMIAEILEKAEEVQVDDVDHRISQMPDGGDVSIVVNKNTEWSGSTSRGKIIIENAVSCRDGKAQYIVPDGIALIVWRPAAVANDITLGASMQLYKHDTMRAESYSDNFAAGGVDTHIRVIDTFRPRVNDHCFKVQLK